jgi:hypothetical protein
MDPCHNIGIVHAERFLYHQMGLLTATATPSRVVAAEFKGPGKTRRVPAPCKETLRRKQ